MALGDGAAEGDGLGDDVAVGDALADGLEGDDVAARTARGAAPWSAAGDALAAGDGDADGDVEGEDPGDADGDGDGDGDGEGTPGTQWALAPGLEPGALAITKSPTDVAATT